MVPVDWLIHWSAFSKIKIQRTSVTTPIRYCLHRIRSTFSIRLNIYHKTHVNETSVHIDLSSYAHTLSLVYRTFDILHNNITKSNEHQKYKVQIPKYSAFRVKTVRFRPQVKTKYFTTNEAIRITLDSFLEHCFYFMWMVQRWPVNIYTRGKHLHNTFILGWRIPTKTRLIVYFSCFCKTKFVYTGTNDNLFSL